MRAHGDHGELAAARHLQHVEIAIAVAGIERFDGHGDQEIALPRVADALALGRVADAVHLMQRMRDVIGEDGLLQRPLAVGLRARGKAGEAHTKKAPIILILWLTWRVPSPVRILKKRTK